MYDRPVRSVSVLRRFACRSQIGISVPSGKSDVRARSIAGAPHGGMWRKSFGHSLTDPFGYWHVTVSAIRIDSPVSGYRGVRLLAFVGPAGLHL